MHIILLSLFFYLIKDVKMYLIIIVMVFSKPDIIYQDIPWSIKQLIDGVSAE